MNYHKRRFPGAESSSDSLSHAIDQTVELSSRKGLDAITKPCHSLMRGPILPAAVVYLNDGWTWKFSMRC